MARQLTRTDEDDPGHDVSAAVQRLANDFQSDFGPTLDALQRLVDGLPWPQSSTHPRSEALKLSFAEDVVRALFLRLGFSRTFSFLRSLSAPELAQRVWISEYLTDMGERSELALFSRQELAERVETFRGFLQAEQGHVLETGAPSREFSECCWLERRLAKTYPVRCSSVTDIIQWVKKVPESPENGFLVERIPCEHNEATLIRGLNDEDAERLPRFREKIFSVKLEVLKAAASCLKTAAGEDFWRATADLLRSSLTSKEADYLTKIDQLFTSEASEWVGKSRAIASMLGDDGPIQSGGLTDIFDFVGHVLKECTIATMHLTRESLGKLVAHEEGEDPRLQPVGRWAYFKFLNTGNQVALDNAIRIFADCDSREARFWDEFRERVTREVIEGFEEEIHISIRAPRSVASQVQLNVHNYARFVIDNLMSIGPAPMNRLSPTSSAQEKKDKVVGRFPPMDGLCWEEVTIKFVSNDAIKVSARGTAKTYMFSEAGFKDERKGDRPDTRWSILKELAKEQGRIDWNSKLELKIRQKAQAAISEIRRRLKKLIGLEDDPFFDYRAKNAYETKFTLLDTSFAQHETEGDEQE